MNQDDGSLASASSPVGDEFARDGGPYEAAHYVSHAVAELSLLARTHRLGMLAYLLDMAKLEADETLRRRSKG